MRPGLAGATNRPSTAVAEGVGVASISGPCPEVGAFTLPAEELEHLKGVRVGATQGMRESTATSTAAR